MVPDQSNEQTTIVPAARPRGPAQLHPHRRFWPDPGASPCDGDSLKNTDGLNAKDRGVQDFYKLMISLKSSLKRTGMQHQPIPIPPVIPALKRQGYTDTSNGRSLVPEADRVIVCLGWEVVIATTSPKDREVMKSVVSIASQPSRENVLAKLDELLTGETDRE